MGLAQSGRSPVVRFGEFELDVRAGDLRRNGERIPLQPKVAELLAALVERPGELVTRDEVRAKLWGSETFVDFDDSVNHAVRKLRDCLGDTVDHPRFVETIPKRGYRFLAPVEPVVRSARAQDGTSADTGRSGASRHRRTWWLAAGATILGIVAIAAIAYTLARSTPPAPSRVMLAVLPMENLTGSDDKEYLSDGLTEEIVTELGRLNPAVLGVIARTSTARYKHTTKTIAEIGRELGVGYVIEGSVRAEGSRLRVTVQLIRVSDQSHAWTEAYDRDSPDTLSIQREVAQQTTRALAITLLPDAQRRLLAETRRVSPEAREAYLKGRFWIAKGTGPAILEGNKLLQQAVELDPASAPAHAALATSWILLGNYGVFPVAEVRPKAKAAASRAIDIDPADLDARLALAGIRMEHEWDFAGAEQDFLAAIRANSSARAHLWYGALLAGLGRADEGVAEIRKAHELDPLSLRVGADLGRALYFARRYDEAAAQLRKVIELDPTFSSAHSTLGLVLLERKQYDAAIVELEKGVALLKTADGYSTWLGYAYGVAGRVAEAKRMRAIQEAHLEKTGVGAEGLSLTYLGAGDTEEAFAWLERAYQARAGMTMLKAYPYWDPLRRDARFADLLRRVGLPR
jgi:TolB-like protein/DNA-binding winged helix-turn-helix (wHTH) protein/Tfp pilus assembly protein PilF